MATRTRLARILRGENGQTASEAAVLLTVIAAALVAVFSVWSGAIASALQATVGVFTG